MAKAFGYKIAGLTSRRSPLGDVITKIQEGNLDTVGATLVGVARHTRPYVPVDTGELINSEKITLRPTSRNQATGTLVYSAPHAAEVHDGPQYNWQKAGASNKFVNKGVQDFVAMSLDNVLAKYGLD